MKALCHPIQVTPRGLRLPDAVRAWRGQARRVRADVQWWSTQRRWRRACRAEGCDVHPQIEFLGVRPPFGCIEIGSHCTLQRDITIWISPDAGAAPRLTLGRKAYIGRNTFLGVYQPIEIGSNALIGAYCYLISANHRFDRRDVPIRDQGFTGAPVTIGEDVWLGTHVVVLPGVTIGRGAVVAAGSTVTKDVPPYEVWGGTPARFIKAR